MKSTRVQQKHENETMLDFSHDLPLIHVIKIATNDEMGDDEMILIHVNKNR